MLCRRLFIKVSLPAARELIALKCPLPVPATTPARRRARPLRAGKPRTRRAEGAGSAGGRASWGEAQGAGSAHLAGWGLQGARDGVAELGRRLEPSGGLPRREGECWGTKGGGTLSRWTESRGVSRDGRGPASARPGRSEARTRLAGGGQTDRRGAPGRGAACPPPTRGGGGLARLLLLTSAAAGARGSGLIGRIWG